MNDTQSQRQRWQRDDEVQCCNDCGTYFGIFIRRHHCRLCGLIFCHNCTNKRISVSSAEYQYFLKHPHKYDDLQRVRVCDSCNSQLGMVRNPHNAEDRHHSTHYHRSQSRSIDDELITDSYRAIAQRRPAHQQQSRGRQRRDISDGMKQCPICGISIAGWQITRQQSHLESCFNSTVSPQTSYVIMSYDKRSDTEECGICLEDFKVGDSIALLSCLCKYHLQCIRLWFAKVSSVKCPLHDSTSLHRN